MCKKTKGVENSTPFCFVYSFWELTDSNGEAEAGIPLKINIIYSRNRTINSNFAIHAINGESVRKQADFFVEWGRKLVF